MSSGRLPCDGCGQSASPEHIARRLQRLQWTTRHRPVHIGTLLLGAISPSKDGDFLYAGAFEGEAAWVLEAAGIQASGKAAGAVLAEFQRGGYFLAYVLDCPLEGGTDGVLTAALVERRVGAVLARVRRSLKPKRALLFGQQLGPLLERFSSAELGCAVILDSGKPFAIESAAREESVGRVRGALAPAASPV